MLTRICAACGRLVTQGARCACQASRHKAYDRERRDKDKARFYHSREWRAVAAAVRARAGYADELAKAGGSCRVPLCIIFIPSASVLISGFRCRI